MTDGLAPIRHARAGAVQLARRRSSATAAHTGGPCVAPGPGRPNSIERVRRPVARPALPVLVVAGIVVLALLWLVRPMWHGIAMLFWTAPLVWLPPLLLLGAGWYMLRRSRRGWRTLEDLTTGVRPPAWLLVFPVLAFFSFVFGAALQTPLVGRAM